MRVSVAKRSGAKYATRFTWRGSTEMSARSARFKIQRDEARSEVDRLRNLYADLEEAVGAIVYGGSKSVLEWTAALGDLQRRLEGLCPPFAVATGTIEAVRHTRESLMARAKEKGWEDAIPPSWQS